MSGGERKLPAVFSSNIAIIFAHSSDQQRLSFGDTLMSQILVDGIGSITLHNNVLRIECVAAGTDGKPQPSGTLVIPGQVAAHVVQALVNGMQELDKKLRDQQQQAPHTTN
jgi:hypothetical protein